MSTSHRGSWEDDPANRERFMALWEQKMPTRSMALRLGISLSTLWMVRRRLKLPGRDVRPPPQEDSRAG